MKSIILLSLLFSLNAFADFDPIVCKMAAGKAAEEAAIAQEHPSAPAPGPVEEADIHILRFEESEGQFMGAYFKYATAWAVRIFDETGYTAWVVITNNTGQCGVRAVIKTASDY